MKAIIKLLVAPVLAVAFVSAAHADDIFLGSWGSNSGQPGFAPATNPGFANSALSYVGYQPSLADPMQAALSHTTFDLTLGLPPWSDAIAPSHWVSQDPNSTVGLQIAPTNGYYTYTSTFNADGGRYGGNLSFLADDTLEFILNGVVVPFKNNSINGACAQGPGPGATCVGNPFKYVFGNPVVLNPGENTLTVIDWQSNGSAAGVDFEGTLTKTPEPGSLLLLGTGLVGLAKLIARKAHRA